MTRIFFPRYFEELCNVEWQGYCLQIVKILELHKFIPGFNTLHLVMLNFLSFGFRGTTMNLVYHMLYLLVQSMHWRNVQGQESELNFCFNSTLEGNQFFLYIACAHILYNINPKC